MKFANATKLDRKSGVAEGRDLQFLLMEKPSPEAIDPRVRCARKWNRRSLRSGRDDKVEGGGPPRHGWK